MLIHRLLAAAAIAVSATAAVAATPAPSAPAAMATSVALPALGPNILGTNAVSIHANRFSGSWANALQDASGSPLLQNLVAPARALSPVQQLAYVQTRVHNNIHWISDATEWGMHDYWATAAQTLAHGAGDMEDRAIVKMHALKALGFNPNDLFLTLARDRVGGPITVLTVRLNGHYVILDDTGGAPFDVDSRRNEFQPILSFGWNGAWAHTRAAPPIPVAILTQATRAK